MLLHTACAAVLFSQTLLIETREEIPRQAMRPRQRIRITSLETGIMDVLFDEGYIVFDRISIKDGKSAAAMDRRGIEFALEQDADLLLVLVPSKRGALWSLVQVEHANKLGGGFADISIIEHDGSEMRRWISLGNFLAVKALGALSESSFGDADLRGLKEIRRSQ